MGLKVMVELFIIINVFIIVLRALVRHSLSPVKIILCIFVCGLDDRCVRRGGSLWYSVNKIRAEDSAMRRSGFLEQHEVIVIYYYYYYYYVFIYFFKTKNIW